MCNLVLFVSFELHTHCSIISQLTQYTSSVLAFRLYVSLLIADPYKQKQQLEF
jgi:hypothetical protein